MAIANATTDFFVALDVDFMPPPNGHRRAANFLFFSGQARPSHNTVFVLPAFEFIDQDRRLDQAELPEDTHDVVTLVEQGKLIRFKSKWHQRGHRNTDFQKWLNIAKSSHRGVSTSKVYDIEYEHSFEPYVLAWRPGMPRLAPEFRGWGKNKMSWFMELHCEGYRFAVLTDLFVVHLNHPTVHQSRKNVDEDRNKPIWDQFTSELEEEWGDTCSSALHQYERWDAFLDRFKLTSLNMGNFARFALLVTTIGAVYRYKQQFVSKHRRFTKPGVGAS